MKNFIIDPVQDHARIKAFILDHVKQAVIPSLLEQIRCMDTGDRSRKLFMLNTLSIQDYYLLEDEGWIEIVLFEGQRLFLFTPKGVDALLPPAPTTTVPG